MSDAIFLVDRGTERTPKNAANSPALIDDYVEPAERTHRPVVIIGQASQRDAWDFLAPFLLGGAVIGGLIHLIERGLFG